MTLAMKSKNSWKPMTESFLPKIRELTYKLEQLEKAKKQNSLNFKNNLQFVNQNERK